MKLYWNQKSKKIGDSQVGDKITTGIFPMKSGPIDINHYSIANSTHHSAQNQENSAGQKRLKSRFIPQNEAIWLCQVNRRVHFKCNESNNQFDQRFQIKVIFHNIIGLDDNLLLAISLWSKQENDVFIPVFFCVKYDYAIAFTNKNFNILCKKYKEVMFVSFTITWLILIFLTVISYFWQLLFHSKNLPGHFLFTLEPLTRVQPY